MMRFAHRRLALRVFCDGSNSSPMKWLPVGHPGAHWSPRVCEIGRVNRLHGLAGIRPGARVGSPRSRENLRYTGMLIGSTLKVFPSDSWLVSVTDSVVLPPAMRECACL